MKILVTGAAGQLGSDVLCEMERRGIEGRGVTRRDFSLTDYLAAYTFIKGYKPDAVIHCAAYTAVDKAESEPDLCFAVNSAATANIAAACADIGAKLIYISTDYVFPGQGSDFYKVDAAKGARNVYGRSKLAGEMAVQEALTRFFIVRTSWVFGAAGHNFVRTMLRLGRSHASLRVVGDQIGSPTYTADLASLLVDMAGTEAYGVYHATNEDICSWDRLAKEIFHQAGMAVEVMPIASTDYPAQAARPYNSRMDKSSLNRAGFKRLPFWEEAVERYIRWLMATQV